MDILGEADRAVLRHHRRGEVDEDHLNWLREVHTLSVTAIHRGQDPVTRPLRLAFECPFRKRPDFTPLPDIAAGDVLGNYMFNLLTLSLMDANQPERISARAHQGHALAIGTRSRE